MFPLTTSRFCHNTLTRYLMVTACFIIPLTSIIGCGAGTASTSSQLPAQNNYSLTDKDRKAIEDNDAYLRKTDAIIAEVEQHLQLNPDGTLALKPQSTRANALSSDALEFAMVAVSKTNAMVKAGQVVIDDDFNVRTTTPITRANERGFRLYWWGASYMLNREQTALLKYRLTIGTVASGTIAALAFVPNPPAVVAGVTGIITSFVLGMGAAAVDYYGRDGRGIEVGYRWSPWHDSGPFMRPQN